MDRPAGRAQPFRPLLIGVLALSGVVMSGCQGTNPGASSPVEASADRTAAPATATVPASSSPAPTSSVAPATEPRLVEIAGGDSFAWRMAVAPDGATALIGQSSGFFPTSRESRIDQVRLQADGTWGEAERVRFSSDASADLDPFFSPDGSRVWFSSIRAVDGEERTDTDIWYVERAPDGSFGEPVNPGPAVNSPAEDLYPSVGPDGTLYFGSDRGGSGFDIWRVPALPDGGWGAPEAMPEPITTAAWEFNPVIAPDGQSLVFTSLSRTGGLGAGDLWFSTPDGDAWSEPKLLKVVNSSADEYHASFSSDGSTMYFIRGGDLYEIATQAVGLPPTP